MRAKCFIYGGEDVWGGGPLVELWGIRRVIFNGESQLVVTRAVRDKLSTIAALLNEVRQSTIIAKQRLEGGSKQLDEK